MAKRETLRERLTTKDVRSKALSATFDRPLLLEGESAEEYDELFARITAAVEPADAIEDIFVREFTTLHWDIQRMRRIKAYLMSSWVYGGLVSELRLLVDPVVEAVGADPSTQRPARELANNWYKRHTGRHRGSERAPGVR